jgi:hypothetical protein
VKRRDVPQIGRYAHAKQYMRMQKALRPLRSRVGRVMRDVERQLDRGFRRSVARLVAVVCNPHTLGAVTLHEEGEQRQSWRRPTRGDGEWARA